MKELGKHLIVELYNCDKKLINDLNHVEKVLLDAAIVAKATVVEHKFHKFSPHGISGVIIIAESHFAIHTWPEFGYCAVDVFTCGDLTDNPAAMEFIKKGLKAEYHSVIEMKRGILNLPDDQIKHKP
ncbi:MAG: adenosylmethionine decarboxylase [Candidatus Margulisbacteria bacterium]|nr:adenosylmethionine decarboxylase [Candidatus Margulisiibacteriota bacterium]